MDTERTTFEEATSGGYSEAHEKALFRAITTAIFTASRVSDVPVVAFRTGETAQALLTVLGLVLACSPAATRTPATIRQTCADLAKTLQRRVASAEADPELHPFIPQAFRPDDTGGRT